MKHFLWTVRMISIVIVYSYLCIVIAWTCVHNICTCRDMRISPFYKYYGGHLGFFQNITCYTCKKKWNPIFFLPWSYSEPESVATSILTSKKSESCFYDKWAYTNNGIKIACTRSHSFPSRLWPSCCMSQEMHVALCGLQHFVTVCLSCFNFGLFCIGYKMLHNTLYIDCGMHNNACVLTDVCQQLNIVLTAYQRNI